MEIDSFTSRGKDCFFSNEYISNLLGLKDRAARQCLYHLIECGYVRVTRSDGRNRFLESCIGCQAEWQKNANQDGPEMPHNNTEIINTYNNSLSNNKRSSKFQKPSVEEVREYCQSRRNGIDAETFINFYESKGWVVGKSPMKDWKAAIRTWEKRNPTPRPQSQFPQRESAFQQTMKVRERLLGGNYGESVDYQ